MAIGFGVNKARGLLDDALKREARAVNGIIETVFLTAKRSSGSGDSDKERVSDKDRLCPGGEVRSASKGKEFLCDFLLRGLFGFSWGVIIISGGVMALSSGEWSAATSRLARGVISPSVTSSVNSTSVWSESTFSCPDDSVFDESIGGVVARLLVEGFRRLDGNFNLSGSSGGVGALFFSRVTCAGSSGGVGALLIALFSSVFLLGDGVLTGCSCNGGVDALSASFGVFSCGDAVADTVVSLVRRVDESNLICFF